VGKQSVCAVCAAEAASEPVFFHWCKRLSGQVEAAQPRVRLRKGNAGFVDADVARVMSAPMPMSGGSLPAALAAGLEVQINLDAGVLRILRR